MAYYSTQGAIINQGAGGIGQTVGIGQESPSPSLWQEITSDEWTKPIAIGATGGLVVGALLGWLIGRKKS